MIQLDEARKALTSVRDPEIGINIVDLGLVYDISEPKPGQVDVKLTLTSPGCPLQDEFFDEIEGALSHVDGVEYVKVDLVWEPPWTPSRMNPVVREELGIPLSKEAGQ